MSCKHENVSILDYDGEYYCPDCETFPKDEFVIITKEQHDKMLDVVSLADNAIFFYSGFNSHIMKLKEALEAYEGGK